MRSARLRQLFDRYLRTDLQEFDIRGKIVFASPIRELLRGYYFDDSSFDANALCVYAFALPLYVPTDHIAFTFGGRLGSLGGGQERWWNLAPGGEAEVMDDIRHMIRAEGQPFLSGIGDPAGLVAHASAARSAQDPYVLEAVAYSYVWLDMKAEALRTADALRTRIAASRPPVPAWLIEVRGRIDLLMRRMIAGNSRELLLEWRSASGARLRLPLAPLT